MSVSGADLGAVIPSAVWRRRVYVGYAALYLLATSVQAALTAVAIGSPAVLVAVLAVLDHLGPAVATLAAANIVVEHTPRHGPRSGPSTLTKES